MYELEDVKKYFHDVLNITEEDEKIEEMYELISNPHLRVNDTDKQWVAFSTQDSENTTVEKAISEILKGEVGEEKIKTAIKEVGNFFIDKDIEMKPRIPFYVMVLARLKG